MKQKVFFTIQYILLVLIAFTLPIHNFFFPKLFVLLIAAWVLEFDFKTKSKRLKDNHLMIPFIVFASFYLLYIIGMTYSTNIDFGVADLILKAPILFAPLIIFTMDAEKWTFKRRKLLFASFIAGCFIMMCISIFHSISLQDNGLGLMNFLYGSASCWFHSSYLAMFYCLSIALITLFLVKYSSSFIEKTVAIIINALFVTAIVFLSSKAGYLSVLSVLLFFCCFVIFVKQIPFKKIIYPISFILLFFVVFFALPSENNRFLSSIKVIHNIEEIEEKVIAKNDSCLKNDEKKLIAPTPINSSIINESNFARVQTWKNTYSLAIERLPFGCGTGDIRNDLTHVHQNNPITKDYSLNAHCQFLQVFATLGIPGILLFLACFVVPLVIAWRKKYFLLIVFTALIAVNFLVESMLEVQSGVSFYAIFNGLLLLFTIAHYQENGKEW